MSGQVSRRLGAAALARHGPDVVEPGQMLEQRRDFLRHEQVDFGLRKMSAQRPQRGRHQHGVAKVFELQRENFFRPD